MKLKNISYLSREVEGKALRNLGNRPDGTVPIPAGIKPGR